MTAAPPADDHPDDKAFLNSIVWESGWLRWHCDRCDHRAPTVCIGHVEASAGPGYEVRFCRPCVARFLRRARLAAAAARRAHTPALPVIN